MSIYEDATTDDPRVAVLEQQLADLRSQVAPLLDRQKMSDAVDVEAFAADFAAAKSADELVALIDTVNRRAYEAVHGAGSAEGVDL